MVACSPKSFVVLQKNADGSTGRIVVSGPEGQVEISDAGQAATLDRRQPESFLPEPGLVETTFAAALDATPAAPAVFRLYFEVGGTSLTAESAALLPDVLAEVARRPGADVSIVGHTDTAGDAAANQALGLERARYVEQQVSAAGLTIERLVVDSHGEANSLVPTPDASGEPRNRRGEIVVP